MSVTNPLTPFLDNLRTAMLGDGANLTDGQLLESFVSRKDEAAFAALVRRHGPMVLGVCRRILRNYHDAEDACQATFLVLARKADSVLPRELVANWLYGVACRTALKARTMKTRQSARERQVTEMPEPEVVEPDHVWRDVQPLLDLELSCLPVKYRACVVLCDLEGKSGEEAARQLGCPEGTVASRLSRGRALLRKRLTRRGLFVASASLTALLSQKAATATIPASLVVSIVKAATTVTASEAAVAGLISAKVAALTEGVMKAMFVNHLQKAMIAVVAATVLCGAGSGLVYWTQGRVKAQTQEAKAATPPKEAAQEDRIQQKASYLLDVLRRLFVPKEAAQGDRKRKEPGQGNSDTTSAAEVEVTSEVESGRAIIKGKIGETQEQVVRIERDKEPLEWRHGGLGGAFEFTVERSDKIPLGGGKTGHGFLLTFKQGAVWSITNVLTESNPVLVGTFAVRRKTDFVTKDGVVAFADISLKDGKKLPMTFRLERRKE